MTEPTKTKYTVLRLLGAPNGMTYRKDDVIELTDKEAKHFHKIKAIGVYISDGDEDPADALPKPRKKSVRKLSDKPSAPATLDDSELLTPQPAKMK